MIGAPATLAHAEIHSLSEPCRCLGVNKVTGSVRERGPARSHSFVSRGGMGSANANPQMAPFYMDSVWRGTRSVHGLPVVSTLQLILDLWHYPIRGREQAEHLITQALSRPHSNG